MLISTIGLNFINSTRAFHFLNTRPTDNTILVSFLLSSNAKKIVTKHRPGIKIDAKTCKIKRACDVYVFRLSFHFCMPPLVVGQQYSQSDVCVCVCVMMIAHIGIRLCSHHLASKRRQDGRQHKHDKNDGNISKGRFRMKNNGFFFGRQTT